MSQTIVQTKFVSPTNTHDSRIRVITHHGRKTVGYDRSAGYGVGISPETVGEAFKAIIRRRWDDVDTVTINSVSDKVSGPVEDDNYWIVDWDVTFKPSQS